MQCMTIRYFDAAGAVVASAADLDEFMAREQAARELVRYMGGNPGYLGPFRVDPEFTVSDTPGS